ADEPLREAARKRSAPELTSALDVLFPRYPDLVSLRVEADGTVVATRDRGRPVDERRERSLDVVRALSRDPAKDGLTLVVTFAADRQKVDGLENSSAIVAKYHQLEASRAQLYSAYVAAFAALLGITSIAT